METRDNINVTEEVALALYGVRGFANFLERRDVAFALSGLQGFTRFLQIENGQIKKMAEIERHIEKVRDWTRGIDGMESYLRESLVIIKKHEKAEDMDIARENIEHILERWFGGERNV